MIFHTKIKFFVLFCNELGRKNNWFESGSPLLKITEAGTVFKIIHYCSYILNPNFGQDPLSSGFNASFRVLPCCPDGADCPKADSECDCAPCRPQESQGTESCPNGCSGDLSFSAFIPRLVKVFFRFSIRAEPGSIRVWRFRVIIRRASMQPEQKNRMIFKFALKFEIALHQKS